MSWRLSKGWGSQGVVSGVWPWGPIGEAPGWMPVGLALAVGRIEGQWLVGGALQVTPGPVPADSPGPHPRVPCVHSGRVGTVLGSFRVGSLLGPTAIAEYHAHVPSARALWTTPGNSCVGAGGSSSLSGGQAPHACSPGTLACCLCSSGLHTCSLPCELGNFQGLLMAQLLGDSGQQGGTAGSPAGVWAERGLGCQDHV